MNIMVLCAIEQIKAGFAACNFVLPGSNLADAGFQLHILAVVQLVNLALQLCNFLFQFKLDHAVCFSITFHTICW